MYGPQVKFVNVTTNKEIKPKYMCPSAIPRKDDTIINNKKTYMVKSVIWNMNNDTVLIMIG